MAFTKRPYKTPKQATFQNAAVMLPSLHEDVLNVLSSSTDEPLSPEPWFNRTGDSHDAMEEYSTHVMGKFECRNPACGQSGWGSKKISIVIRRYPGNGYNAPVFKQRCRGCKRQGVLRLDENSYIERVAYRLKKWAGVSMERPEYRGEDRGPPHESSLCEGCRMGYCRAG